MCVIINLLRTNHVISISLQRELFSITDTQFEVHGNTNWVRPKSGYERNGNTSAADSKGNLSGWFILKICVYGETGNAFLSCSFELDVH